jgi:tetratricopeptide (TPR) repeat protein/mono/diheme cytochrome c family protein
MCPNERWRRDNRFAQLAGGLLFGVAVAACQPARVPDARSSARDAPTYNKDVAPILFEHCATCHRPANPNAGKSPDDQWCVAGAPFSLIEYRDAREHAKQIADATARRTMPPWLPERGAGTFSNARGLRDDQIAIIQRWAEEGTVEGDAADKPPLPKWPDGWQLGRPDLVIQMPDAYQLQATGSDVFRNFVVPVPLTANRYVRAIEFRPGNPRSLHHASVGVDRLRVSRKVDRGDREPGFAAMPDDQVENVYGWTPGKAPYLEPADRSWTLERGSDLVLQLHMLPTGAPEVVQPSVGLFFSDRPPTRVSLPIKLESKAIDIPAGQADYAIDDRYVLPADVDVLSVYPHAHYLAKEMKGTATLPDGTVKPLIWIRSWDFRWQDQYRYVEPLFLPKGTTLAMHFTYDNSDGNPRNPHRPAQRVKWGPQSSDEMGALWLDVLPRRDEDVASLTRDYNERSLRADLSGAEMQVGTSPRDALAHNYLATKYLQAGRVPDAIAQLEEALRLKPDDAEAHSNMASALQFQGRLAEALQHAREAQRLKPDDDRVHFNLGNVLNATGQVEDAIRELRRATQINPENADAHFNLAVIVGPRNRIDEAIVHLRKAIEINPRHADAHRNLGVALGFQGRVDEAIREVQAALRLQPDSAEAREQLARLLKAKSARTAAR